MQVVNMSNKEIDIGNIIRAVFLLWVFIMIVWQLFWQTFGEVIISSLILLGKITLVIVAIVMIYAGYRYIRREEENVIQTPDKVHKDGSSKQLKDREDMFDYGNHIYKVLHAIEEFDPPRKYDTEDKYRDILFAWLKSRFPETKIEHQVGASRPDIVVSINSTEIAIEVKGPTTSRDLQTIADKIIRYRQYFDKIIVVLFDIKASPKRYEEWLRGIENNFRDIIIVEKK